MNHLLMRNNYIYYFLSLTRQVQLGSRRFNVLFLLLYCKVVKFFITSLLKLCLSMYCILVFVWRRNYVSVYICACERVFRCLCLLSLFVAYEQMVKEAQAFYGQASCRAAVGTLKEQLSIVLLPHWPLSAFPCQQDWAQSKALKDSISVCSWQGAVCKSPFPLVQGQFCGLYYTD